MSVRWLIEAYTALQHTSMNYMIVPVMVSYDRIYEARNLTTEMISGEKKDYTLWTSIKKIGTTAKDSLGHIYVKYLDPINLQDYLAKQCKGNKLVKHDFESIAL